MSAIAQLTTFVARKALDAHYSKIRELHLRKLFFSQTTPPAWEADGGSRP